MDDFLKIEYEQCIDLIKYYEGRHDSLMKFSAGLSSSIPSVLLLFNKLGGSDFQLFWSFTALVSGLTTISLLAIFMAMVRIRLYFLAPARQANAIRKHEIERLKGVFDNNRMYLDDSVKAFKWTSSQTLTNVFASLQIGAFAGVTFFSLLSSDCKYLGIGPAVGFGLFSSLIVFSLSAWYLIGKSSKNADQSVHGREN